MKMTSTTSRLLIQIISIALLAAVAGMNYSRSYGMLGIVLPSLAALLGVIAALGGVESDMHEARKASDASDAGEQ
jgi:hypothetical protein